MVSKTSTMRPLSKFVGDKLAETIANGFGRHHSTDDGSAEAQERQSLAAQHGPAEILRPEDIAENPMNKGLGQSSKVLKITDFDLLKTLGTGTFARVWMARISSPETKEEEAAVFALKILRKIDIVRLKQVEHVRSERITLGAVAGHPFITKLIRTFSDREHLYMLLEYCPGGELFTYLRNSKRFNEPTARFYAAEVVLVLEYLHETLSVAYRDLKPENILLGADGHIKIVDFGFAKKIEKDQTYTLCGTPEYLPPEVIKTAGHGKAVDLWALGILLYEFLLGQPPFWDRDPAKIYPKILKGNLIFPHMDIDGAQQLRRDRTPSANTGVDVKRPSREAEWNSNRNHLSPDLSSEDNKLWKDPESGKEWIVHPSPAARSLIEALLKVNASQRIGNLAGGIKDIKDHEFFKGTDWDALYWKKVKGPIIPGYSGGADGSCFDDYDPPSAKDLKGEYTDEMDKEFGNVFAEF